MVSISVLTVMLLNCGPQPDSTTLMRMRVIPGLPKKCDKGLLGSSCGMHVGMQT